MSFFSTVDSGVTLNRFSQDLMLIDMELPVAALNTFASKSAISLHSRNGRTENSKRSCYASRKWC